MMRQLTPDTPLDLNMSLSDSRTCTQDSIASAEDVVTLL